MYILNNLVSVPKANGCWQNTMVLMIF